MKRKFTRTKLIGILAFLLFAKLGSAQVTAAFTYTMGAAGTVSFTNLSSSTATTMCCDLWTFFDDPSAPLQTSGLNVVHTFTSNGSYIVRLSAVDNLNNADSTQSVITITNTTCGTNAVLGFHSPSATNWIAGIWAQGNIVAASWNWGDSSPNSTGLAPSHTYSVAASYTVCVTYTNSCGAVGVVCNANYFFRTGSLMLNVNGVSTNPAQPALATGIGELKNTDELIFDIYPNPSSGEFMVTGIKGKVELINSLGQTIEILQPESDRVKIHGLTPGIYYLKSENSRVSKKVIIQN